MSAPIFDNSYAALPARFYERVAPEGAPEPRLVALNEGLATQLGLDLDWLRGAEGLAMLSGNRLPEGAASIAQAYAGHQFGNLVMQLGDGRAVMIGEIKARDGTRRDVQLKGSGPTPFSRGGDGLAWLGPVLREYLVSEFMAAMGVPTTRALAAVTTGQTVWRETALPGAILTRVAASHIRVGTFEYFALRGDHEALQLLVDHVTARHYPQAESALGLLQSVVAAQARLIARWMGLGFIHGVMNTDNMAVSGETIDYGPCAFMDSYHPDTVFSSIDRRGRYAWSQQPQVAIWNLAQLGSCLIPCMGDSDRAVELATSAVHSFPDIYQQAWREEFCAKIGLPPSEEAVTLVNRLLDLMASGQADFTRVFAGLSDGSAGAEFADPAAFDDWARSWQEMGPDNALMEATNPRRIPRNHRIQQVIDAGLSGDFAPFEQLLAAVTHPRGARPEWQDLALAPLPEEAIKRTFCGT